MSEPFTFALTKRDSQLVGNTRLADPIGVLPIWSRIARQLVPHLTAQTSALAGFELLIVVLDAYRRPQMQAARDLGISARHVFMVAEQLAAYAVTHNHGAEKWPLPGRRMAFGWSRDAPKRLSLRSKVLLDNQAGAGVWGLYRGAAGRADLLDQTLEVPSESVMAWLDSNGTRLSDAALRGLAKVVDAVAKAPNQTISDLDGSFSMRSSIAGELRRTVCERPNRTLLRRHLFDRAPVLQGVARLLVKKPDQAISMEFFRECEEALPEGREIFNSILSCEKYIGVLEAAFERLGSSTQPISRAAQALNIDLGALRHARKEFSGLKSHFTGDVLGKRFAALRDLDLDSRDSCVSSLIAAHHIVADQRGSARWIELEGGQLRPAFDFGISDENAVLRPGLWRNDYYLRSVRSIYMDVKAR
jgi:hypothetical protein